MIVIQCWALGQAWVLGWWALVYCLHTRSEALLDAVVCRWALLARVMGPTHSATTATTSYYYFYSYLCYFYSFYFLLARLGLHIVTRTLFQKRPFAGH